MVFSARYEKLFQNLARSFGFEQVTPELVTSRFKVLKRAVNTKYKILFAIFSLRLVEALQVCPGALILFRFSFRA